MNEIHIHCGIITLKLSISHLHSVNIQFEYGLSNQILSYRIYVSIVTPSLALPNLRKLFYRFEALNAMAFVGHGGDVVQQPESHG